MSLRCEDVIRVVSPPPPARVATAAEDFFPVPRQSPSACVTRGEYAKRRNNGAFGIPAIGSRPVCRAAANAGRNEPGLFRVQHDGGTRLSADQYLARRTQRGSDSRIAGCY